MDWEIVRLWSQEHTGLAVWAAVGILVGLWMLVQRFPIFTWYGIVVAAPLIGALLFGNLLYFYVFMLGMITAFIEIIGKFQDEPIKTFQTKEALFYHLFN